VLAALVAGACGAGDDTTDGTRGACAAGGVLDPCPDGDHTPEGACWRFVDCGVIPLHSASGNTYDWRQCVRDVQSLSTIAEQAAISCILASTCDQLKTPDDAMGNACFDAASGGR